MTQTERQATRARFDRSPLWAAAPAMALAAAALLPFLGKAFTIDDTVFLLEAEQVLRDPLHPTAFELAWYDTPQRLSSLMASGPVTPYLWVPAVLLGGAEWLAHLTQLLMLALALVATASLALRLGWGPKTAGLAALLVVASPSTLAMASTNMPDVPAMALGTIGIERLLAWKQMGRWHQAATAALALALAALTRSHLLLLLGPGALLLRGGGWASEEGRAEVGLARWLPLGTVPVLVAWAAWLTRDPVEGGGSIAGGILAQLTTSGAGKRLLAMAGYWALSTSLVVPWLLIRPRRLPWLVFLVAFPVAGWELARLGDHRWWFMGPVAALTAAALADLIRSALDHRRDPEQLALVAWLLLAVPVVLYVQVAAKYLVPSVPAAALLVARALAQAPWRRGRAVLGITLAAGVIAGVLIVRADAAFAGLARRAAAELIAPPVARGERVWFAGHWGFQWYAMKAGGQILTRGSPQPAAGDLLVVAGQHHGSEMANQVSHKRLLDGSLFDSTPGPRVMSAGAGFYSSHYGYLPLSWGSGEIARFKVWRVE